MRINITAGECLKDILEARYPGERFVPFNEAMIQGAYSAPLFSEGFIRERSLVNEVSEKEYRDRMSGFIEILEHAGDYDEILLWFGDEPFCMENRKTALEALAEWGYRGTVLLNTVDEITGEIKNQESVSV